jgi:hypothetical protein
MSSTAIKIIEQSHKKILEAKIIMPNDLVIFLAESSMFLSTIDEIREKDYIDNYDTVSFIDVNKQYVCINGIGQIVGCGNVIVLEAKNEATIRRMFQEAQ